MVKWIIAKKKEELSKIGKEENLKPGATEKIIKQSFERGELSEYRTDIVKILPATSMFGKTNGETRLQKKKTVIQKLRAFFERFTNI